MLLYNYPMTLSIGAHLQQKRLERKLSLKKASEATAIRVYYLEAMEADEFEVMSSPVQARGFLRAYANFLGLDGEGLVAVLRGDPDPAHESNPGVDSEPSPDSEPAPVSPELNPVAEVPPTEPDIAEQPENEEAGIPESIIFPTLPYLNDDEQGEGEEDLAFSQPSSSLAQSIYIEIGQQLSQRRDLLGLTHEEIERHTHIRKRHLTALEAGAFSELPSPVQARGMLTAYARFLDLDAETLLLRFADALQAERLERHPFLGRRTRPREASTPVAMWFGRLFSTDLILGGGLVLAMVVFSVWGAARVISLRAEKQAELNISQSISEELLQSTVVAPAAAGTPTVAETALVEAPTSTPELPPVSNAPVSVTIIVTGRTWMRVTVDGEIVLEERVSAGSVFTYDADEQVEVLAADGGRVQIIYNDEKLGAMSIPGQVANMVYSTSGALVPTPTATPVPSATPRPTRTPVPSPTPRPTRTPRPTATQS